MRQIKSILNKTNRGDRPLNILCFPTHERYESNLAKTDHNFWSFYHPQVKEWNEKYGKSPTNYHLVKNKFDQDLVQKTVDFDLILSQNKFGQFQLAQELSKKYNVPICSIEHTLPHPNWTPQQLKGMKDMKAHTNYFISEFSRAKWGWTDKEADVIHHGIDTNLFNDKRLSRENVCLSVVNEWESRDVWCGYKFWRAATKDINIRVVGDNPGLSVPAESAEALSLEYNKARIFLNTSLVSPIPTALLEAMSCGCICISTATCMIPEIISHQSNGLLVSSPQEMAEQINNVLSKPEDYVLMGINARDTITQRFSLPKFVDKWNEILNRTAEIEL